MQYSYVNYFSQEKSFSLTCMSCIEVVSGPLMNVFWPAVTPPVTEAVIGSSDQRANISEVENNGGKTVTCNLYFIVTTFARLVITVDMLQWCQLYD